MKRNRLLAGVIVLLLVIGIGFSFWLYDHNKEMEMYQRGIIYGYENTLNHYEYLLSLQRNIINEEDEEHLTRMISFYQNLSFEFNPQRDTGELLKIFYVKSHPDSAVADYNFNDIIDPYARGLQGNSKEEWLRQADNFEQAIEQMRKELEVIKTELDLPPDEA